MPTKLLGTSILNGSSVVLAIELTGNKKGRRRQHELLLDYPLRVAQADILLTFVLNGKGIDVSQRWQCHGRQAYPKPFGASILSPTLLIITLDHHAWLAESLSPCNLGSAMLPTVEL